MIPRTLGDLGAIYDGPHATPTRRETGAYFLNIASLSNGRLDLSLSDHVNEVDFAAWTKRIRPRENDLLFSYETRLGEAALMPAAVEACLGRRMALLRPNPAVIDPRFLLYYYLSPEFKNLIASRSIHGATVSRIPLNRMAEWPITVPGLHVQNAIGEVLGVLDDKIAANVTLTQTAEYLASALFAALPRGNETRLSSTAAFINGRAFTKDASGTGRVVVRIAELNSGLGRSTIYSDAQVADNSLVRPGDLLFAWSGSLTVQRWYRPEAIVNQHIFKVVPRTPYPMWLVYQLLRENLEEFRAIAADKATTMGHIQRHHLDRVVAIPEGGAIEKETELMEGLWKRALAAETENLTLAELRDTLLPALMSGRLRVKDAERQVEDAV